MEITDSFLAVSIQVRGCPLRTRIVLGASMPAVYRHPFIQMWLLGHI